MDHPCRRRLPTRPRASPGQRGRQRRLQTCAASHYDEIHPSHHCRLHPRDRARGTADATRHRPDTRTHARRTRTSPGSPLALAYRRPPNRPTPLHPTTGALATRPPRHRPGSTPWHSGLCGRPRRGHLRRPPGQPRRHSHHPPIRPPHHLPADQSLRTARPTRNRRHAPGRHRRRPRPLLRVLPPLGPAPRNPLPRPAPPPGSGQHPPTPLLAHPTTAPPTPERPYAPAQPRQPHTHPRRTHPAATHLWRIRPTPPL